MFKTEYMVCWVFRNIKNWEIVNGEEELQLFVSELVVNGIDENYILIFDMENNIG